MATAPSRGKNARSTPPITLLLWQDALLEWGIPTILIGAMAAVALLGAFEVLAQTTGVLTLGCLLLVLVGFFLFKPLLIGAANTERRPLTWGLAAVWLLLTCAQFYFAIFVGQEVTAGAIATDGTGIDLPLATKGTVYDLIVEGKFATAGEGAREGGYSLLLEQNGQKVQEYTGKLTETLSQQRLGRRGSTTTRHLHNHALHPLISPGEGAYRLTVARVDPQLTPTLQIALYRDTYPEKTFWLLSVLLLIGAYIVELWNIAIEPPLVMATAAAIVFGLTFRNLGVPPHSYQDIVGAVMVAAIGGPLIGWVFHFIADFIARNLGFSHTKLHAALDGKSSKKKR
jgi:hypothetical protein